MLIDGVLPISALLLQLKTILLPNYHFLWYVSELEVIKLEFLESTNRLEEMSLLTCSLETKPRKFPRKTSYPAGKEEGKKK